MVKNLYLFLYITILLFGFLHEVKAENIIFQEKFLKNSNWSLEGSSGVKKSELIYVTSGPDCPCIKINYEFSEGGGFLRIIRPMSSFMLPEDYHVQFTIRGQNQNSGLEFKFLDQLSSNVWWHKFDSFTFNEDPQITTLGKENIHYAWGPDAMRELQVIKGIDFALTTSQPDKGSLFISKLQILDLSQSSTPEITASSTQEPYSAGSVYDKSLETSWKSEIRSAPKAEWVQIEFTAPLRFGAINIDWDETDQEAEVEIQIQGKDKIWQTVSTFSHTFGKSSYIPMFDVQIAKAIRLNLKPLKSDDLTRHESYSHSIKEINFLPVNVVTLPVKLILKMASDRPKGAFPKFLSKKQSYWTTIPIPKIKTESYSKAEPIQMKETDLPPVIMNEEGMLEFGHGFFSIEPVVTINNEIITWGQADDVTPSLVQNYLPLVNSRWMTKTLELTTTAFSKPIDNYPVVYVRYRLRNTTKVKQRTELKLLFRPIPVTPYWQFEKYDQWMTQAFEQIDYNGNEIVLKNKSLPYSFYVVPVQKEKTWHLQQGPETVEPLSPNLPFETHPFYSGPVYDSLIGLKKKPKGFKKIEDQPLEVKKSPIAKPSGIFSLPIEIEPLKTKEVVFAVFHSSTQPIGPGPTATQILSNQDPTQIFQEAENGWKSYLGKVSFWAPKAPVELLRSLKTAIAHIIANRKGPALEPGPRRYTTSWIRDGSHMASTLLQMGHYEIPKEFLIWFAQFQKEDGFVPCCVTVDKTYPLYIEHDSTGQFLYLIAEILRYTGDEDLLTKVWPQVVKSVDYIRTAREGKNPSTQDQVDRQSEVYGLMPRSVSHEGYLGNPSHVYWDNFWTLRGLKDAVYLAKIKKDKNLTNWKNLENEFRADLTQSLKRLIARKNLNYIPSSVEMAEMDASGTVVALSLLGETHLIDPTITRKTLEIYLENLNKRINSTSTETNHSAYELRVVEPMVRLGMVKEAHQVLEFFLEGQRRKAWNQWPEITWKDPSLPTGIGDMPHSWIGSEYAKAVRSLFIIENLEKPELIIGPGILEKWLQVKDTIGVDKLPTPYGFLRYALSTNRRIQNGETITIFSTLEIGLKQQKKDKKVDIPFISLPSPPDCSILKVETQEPSAQIERTKLSFRAKTLTAQIQWLCSSKNHTKKSY